MKNYFFKISNSFNQVFEKFALLSLFIISFLLMAVTSCKKETISNQPSGPAKAETITTNSSESVALVDARIRSINSELFIKELIIIDFSKDKSGQVPNRFTFEGTTFADDGTGFDLKAGDNIFSSTTSFKYTDKVPYISTQSSRSVLESPIVNRQFKYMDSLQEVINQNNQDRGPVIILECDISWVCGCWGTCCGFKVENCHFKIGWE